MYQLTCRVAMFTVTPSCCITFHSLTTLPLGRNLSKTYNKQSTFLKLLVFLA